MYIITLFPRAALTALVLFGWAARPCLGQTKLQFANRVVNTATAGLVTEDFKAADKDLTTRAILRPTALLSTTNLRVAFEQVALAGQPAGVYIKSDNPLNVNLAGAAAINTYLTTKTGTTLVKTYYTSNLLALGLGGAADATNFTFTPTEPFNEIEVKYQSVLAVGKDIEFYEAYTTVATPLPVTLTAFSGKATAAGVTLSWATASEQHNDHFVVERAEGTPETFRALGQVAGGGTSAQGRRYQFVDAAPRQLNYYRLRQVDFDGTETFGPVVAVAATPAGTQLVAYPSPAAEVLTVVGARGAHLGIFDQYGRLVRLADVVAAEQPQPLDVRSLPDGVYFLRDAATGHNTRFIKSERGGAGHISSE